MEMEGLLNYEVNMLTEENVMSRDAMIKAIRAEFDFIKMCQAMIKPFGYGAREVLDRFIALSLRKLLCDKDSLLRKVSRDFKMPPLVGGVYNCPGENQEMKLVQINPDVHVKCQKDWVPLDMWLREKISWIEKDENDIPLAYGDGFYCSLAKKLEDTCFKDLFSKDIIDDNGKKTTIWRLKNHEENKQLVFNILKEHGYYELSIWRMIKHIADRQGAHMQKTSSIWIKAANQGKDVGYSAMSVFATQMIYAATKQIKELSDYYVTEPIMETL